MDTKATIKDVDSNKQTEDREEYEYNSDSIVNLVPFGHDESIFFEANHYYL